MSTSAKETVRQRQLWTRNLGCVDAHLANSGCAPIKHCIGATSEKTRLRSRHSVGAEARHATNRSSIIFSSFSLPVSSLPFHVKLDLQVPNKSKRNARSARTQRIYAEFSGGLRGLINLRAFSPCH